MSYGKLYVYLDFEYNKVNEKHVSPLCVAYQTVLVHPTGEENVTEESCVWLQDEEQRAKFVASMEKAYSKDNVVFVSYAWEAESRALMALGLDPVPLKAVDLYVEYRMLTNHCNDMMFGKQLIRGKEKYLPVKELYEESSEEGDSGRAEHNLAAATYKLLGIKIDTDEKDAVRRMIIEDTYKDTDKQRIMDYCFSDIKHLRTLHKAMNDKLYSLISSCQQLPDSLKKRDTSYVEKEQIARARYAALTARMVSLGYPLDVEAARNLGRQVTPLMDELRREINDRLFTSIGIKPFEWDRKERKFKKAVKVIQTYIMQSDPNWRESWLATDSELPSLAEESLERAALGARHNYADTLPALLLKEQRFSSSLKGFDKSDTMQEVGKRKSSFWDSLGSDGRVRPYFGIYGSQSSRSQPKSTGFIFLKSSVFRGLVQPPKGKVIVASDYSSQEFLLAALVSGDKNMIESYASGDVYLAFGKLAGAVPPTATKKTHGDERERLKSSVLGMSYKMGAKSLAAKMTADTGKFTTEDEAQRYIDMFEEAYPKYAEWGKDLVESYGYYDRSARKWVPNGDACIRLGSGWRMWSDNQNWRSIANMPIQGLGADVMRAAVYECYLKGIDVIFTLHDALYIEIDYGDWGKIDTFIECMQAGFKKAINAYFDGKVPHFYPIRQDWNAWGPEFTEECEVETPQGKKVPCQQIYVDKRTKKEFEEKWKKYLWPEEEELDI